MIDDDSNIDLDTIHNKDELEIIIMKLNIHQIAQSIVESQQRVAESNATIEKMRAETDKAIKERKAYPWIPLVIAMIGSSAFFAFLTMLFGYYVLKQPTP